jgi:hypothetical protein
VFLHNTMLAILFGSQIELRHGHSNRPATRTLPKAGLRQEIEERNGANGLVQQYVYGSHIDEPLMLDRNLNGDSRATGSGDQRFFYHQNTLHSVFALTNSTGKLVEGYQYDAYSRHYIRARCQR